MPGQIEHEIDLSKHLLLAGTCQKLRGMVQAGNDLQDMRLAVPQAFVYVAEPSSSTRGWGLEAKELQRFGTHSLGVVLLDVLELHTCLIIYRHLISFLAEPCYASIIQPTFHTSYPALQRAGQASGTRDQASGGGFEAAGMGWKGCF